MISDIRTVRCLLKKTMRHCHCDALDQCRKGIFRSRCGNVATKSVPLLRHSERLTGNSEVINVSDQMRLPAFRFLEVSLPCHCDESLGAVASMPVTRTPRAFEPT